MRTVFDGEGWDVSAWRGEGTGDGGRCEGGRVGGRVVDDLGDKLRDVGGVDIVDEFEGWEEKKGCGF